MFNVLSARILLPLVWKKAWKYGSWIRNGYFAGDLESWRLNLKSTSQGSESLGILLEEGRMSWWMESPISTPWDFKWPCDGSSSVLLIPHRQALLSPWYSVLRFSSAADSCGGCEKERQKAQHLNSSCWGNGGQIRQRQEIRWLMQSLSRERLLCCCLYIPMCLPW